MSKGESKEPGTLSKEVYIFLDFDGVITTQDSYHRALVHLGFSAHRDFTRESGWKPLEPRCVTLLQRLIQEIQQAGRVVRLVYSTSWAEVFEAADLDAFLAHHVTGIPPGLNLYTALWNEGHGHGLTREQSIAAYIGHVAHWTEAAPTQVLQSTLILEDLESMGPLESRTLRSSAKEGPRGPAGFNEVLLEQARKLLDLPSPG